MSHRRLNQLWHQRWRWVVLSLLALIFAWAVSQPTIATAQSNSNPALPIAKPHPLPASLAQWSDPRNSGNYFDQIQPVSVGYLVWSRFPVTVFVEPLKPEDQPGSFSYARSQAWISAVTTAIAEWNPYLPLQPVNQPDTADIQIWRSAPPLQLERDRPNAPLRPSRVRAAETRFQLYSPTSPLPHSPTLTHRFTIQIRPDQAPQYTLVTARHELGHAIGIWGHSQQPTDALYFSQVAQPPPISARDVNTLKQIYEQPTQLGWMP
jgi:predicted Zn-dependent protease